MVELSGERARSQPAQKVEVNERKCKREQSGKEEPQTQDQAGSPDEENGQRTLGVFFFGFKRQRFQFVCDVQENDDFETPRVDRAAYVSGVHKCKSVMMDSTELPSS